MNEFKRSSILSAIEEESPRERMQGDSMLAAALD